MAQLLRSVPRGLMAANNLLFAAAAYAFDWNATHIYNPRWPPHAKFHNGQSMTFGLLAAFAAVYLLARRPRASGPLTPAAARDAVFVAALVGSLTTAAGLSAILYPGTAWADPETDPEIDPAALAALAVFPLGKQAYIFLGQLAVNWGCYAWEMARLARATRACEEKQA